MATEDDHLGVEQVGQHRGADAELPTGLVQRAEGAVVARLGPPDDLGQAGGHVALVQSVTGTATASTTAFMPDRGLPATAPAAGALDGRVADRHVPDLARRNLLRP